VTVRKALDTVAIQFRTYSLAGAIASDGKRAIFRNGRVQGSSFWSKGFFYFIGILFPVQG
jgi:hypothetical protein